MIKKSLNPIILNTDNKSDVEQANIIAAKFSNKAFNYERFANVQNFAAKHLDNYIAQNIFTMPPTRVLEIGCGTGFLSQHLSTRFSDSEIYFLDPATAMLQLCKQNLKKHLNSTRKSNNIIYIEKRIEDYLNDPAFSSIKYSLITSSFALHWVSDLSAVIRKLIDRLELGGQIIFSYPTNKSFPEWKAVCKQLELPYTGNQLPSFDQLKSSVMDKNASLSFSEYSVKLSFPNALEFFQNLKNVGADTAVNLDYVDLNGHKPQLSLNEFRHLLKAWKNTLTPKHGSGATYNQTVHCTYWLVEGIITRLS